MITWKYKHSNDRLTCLTLQILGCPDFVIGLSQHCTVHTRCCLGGQENPAGKSVHCDESLFPKVLCQAGRVC